jgi:hypothetical protein
MQEEGSLVVYEEDDNDTEKAPFVIDSLPYVDVVHEDYEQYALSLVEEEMKTLKPPKVARLPPTNLKSKLLQNDYETLSKNPNQPPELELSNRAKEPSKSTVEAWRQAVQEARAEYEGERERSVVLEIEKSDASTYQWKHYGTMLESIHKDGQTRMTTEKDAVDLINAERQKHQEKAGQSLYLLSSQFQGAVQKRFQLLAAVQNLKESLRTSNTTASENGGAHD